MSGFATPLEHLDAVLGLVGVLVERQVIAQWELGRLPRPADTSAVSEVDRLFGRGAGATVAGTERLHALDAELARREAELAERVHPELPLERLRAAFELSPREERVVHVTIAAELSPQVRALLRYLANDPARHTIDRTLLETLVYGRAGRTWLHRELGPRGLVFERSLLDVLPGRESLMFEGLRAAARVVELASGVLRVAPELEDVVDHVAEPAGFDELVVPAALREQLIGLVGGGTSGMDTSPTVVLAGPTGSGRRALIGAAAHACGLGVLRIRTGELPRDPAQFGAVMRAALREATLLEAVPVLVDVHRLAEEDGPSRVREQLLDATLATWRRPLAATASHSQAQPLKLARGTLVLEAPPLLEADRETLWRRTLRGATGVDFAQIAARFPVTPGMLVHASHAASAMATARDGAITEGDLQLGLRSAMDAAVAALGTRLTRAQKWEDLVAPPDVMDALTEFIARVRFRRRVYDEWGFADKYTKGLGLSALFTGPPGTGKTMAATLIAGQLGLDIYQVDVSRIVSKFIGETEKNLATVFDAAEAGHAIVLFDEADALFSARGEVRSSVDRYANLEVNYLLQRLERFAGITILTTNLATAIDAAFKRRISFTVEFPMPEERERERIWRAHLPARADVAPNTDFGWLAERHVMSGGHIRNAVLRAAFLAAAEGAAIRFDHLKRAAEVEAQAMGRVA
ncbi:MAG: ATP-binding protein [Deltaproteobacteria bacterium]|nr:ATP-binding protein [Deltaproteobacteria bacterium]